jgi:hypothetical protein
MSRLHLVSISTPGARAAMASALRASALGAWLLLGSASAQAGPYQVPTLSDGTTPDFRGLWQVRDSAYLNIEGHPALPGVAASHSIIIDPADGKIPYRSDAIAQRERNLKDLANLDPASRCYQAGVPRATYLPSPLQIVQSTAYSAIVYQDNHAFRVIYPTSRPHLDGVDWWMGDSRGHWDGGSWVIDVTTLNDLAWFDAAGNHHSNEMHVVERYTRTSPTTLQYEARIEDPKTFTQPWTLRETLYAVTGAHARIAEDECLEDSEGVHRHISPTDVHNLLRNNYRRWSMIDQLPATAH